MADRRARILSGIGREMKANPPKILAKTRRKKGKTMSDTVGPHITATDIAERERERSRAWLDSQTAIWNDYINAIVLLLRTKGAI